jgi:hypothetical protein
LPAVRKTAWCSTHSSAPARPGWSLIACIPVPKSISYGSLEQDAMEKVHDDIVKFLRQEHAQKALWRHLNAEQRAEMMAAIIDPFEHGGAL